jgi:hypothetical protein
MIKTVITIELTDGEHLANAIKSLGFGWPNALVPPTVHIANDELAAGEIAEQTYTTIKVENETIHEAGEIGNNALLHIHDEIAVGTLRTAGETTGDSTLVVTRKPLGPMDGERKRGEAAPGHRRRTNAQIKEDAVYFAEVAKMIGDKPTTQPLPPDAEPMQISTGEERISPEDAADEAAESEARRAERGGKLTIEDLRAAVGRYTEKFGAKASIENIRSIVGCAILEVPESEIGAAISRVEAAIAGSIVLGVPFADVRSVEPPKPGETESVFGDALADKPTKPIHATKTDVVEAFTAYGKKYDGTTDPAKMEIARQDLLKILEKTFGAGTTTISKIIPQTPEGFGRAMTAVYEAIRDNPFRRAVKS